MPLSATCQPVKKDYLAGILSVIVHGILLIIFYYCLPKNKAIPSTHTYRITIKPSPIQNKAPSPQAIEKSTTVTPASSKQTKKGKLLQPEAEHIVETTVAEQLPIVDERGLYSNTQPQPAASLELPGWKWDTAPHVQDQTDEVGTLVFEIVIDDTGEIIVIKTLEKTVSPLVEQLYKDEVAKLTFSKTNTTTAYKATSTGKITFLLQYKNNQPKTS